MKGNSIIFDIILPREELFYHCYYSSAQLETREEHCFAGENMYDS